MQGRGRGIVSTCNYAAREFGVRSAMPISEAWRRCPGHPFGPARFIRGTRSLYSMASRRVMRILRQASDKFEQASIDEAYLDVTEAVKHDWDEAMALARRLQRDSCEGGANSFFWNRANTNYRKDVLRSEQTKRYPSSSTR